MHILTASVFDFARQLSTAKSSSDLVELWTAHTRKQLGILNEQIKELTALGQKFANESAGPIAPQLQPGFQESFLTDAG